MSASTPFRFRFAAAALAACALPALAGDAAPTAPAAAPTAPAAVSAPTVKEAIARLRAANPADDEARAALRLDPAYRAAWQAVVDAGPAALPELRAAVGALKPAGGTDDFFRIVAGGLLWRICGLDGAAEAAALWNDPALDLSIAPVVVHSIAYQAARTRDPRALPLLFASFREAEGEVDLPRGNLSLSWPETAEYAWAAYGPAGQGELAKLLQASKDDNQVATAVWLLARDGCVSALPAIRLVARRAGDENELSRQTAIMALGLLGHPQDYPFLAEGFEASVRGPELGVDVDAYIDALAEFGDMRAATPLINHLVALKTKFEYPKAEDGEADRLRLREMIVGLIGPQELALLRKEAENLSGSERAGADALIATFFAAIGTPAGEFDKLPPAEQAKKLAGYRAAVEEDFILAEDAPKPTREVFAATVKQMRDTGALPFGTVLVDADTYMIPAHLLAAGTSADINDLLEARAVVARKLSAEALGDLDLISAMVLRLARADYRKDVGICERVEGK